MQNQQIIQRLEVSNIDAETFKNLLNEMKQSIISEIKEQLHPTTDKKLTRKQVAKIFDITVETVWKWQNTGILKPYKVGNRIYFFESEINEVFKNKSK